jgi:hypothetical protein
MSKHTSRASSPTWDEPRLSEAYLLGRWFTAARREGLLPQLPPEAWHTLSAILSFTSREGTRLFTADQLAVSLAVSRDEALRRLDTLARHNWQGAPLLTLELDADGQVAGADLAPLELLARVQPPETASAERSSPSVQAGAAASPSGGEGPLAERMEAVGLNPFQIDQLFKTYPVERIARQLQWLSGRQARNPAALLIRAIEQDWEAPGRAESSVAEGAGEGKGGADA